MEEVGWRGGGRVVGLLGGVGSWRRVVVVVVAVGVVGIVVVVGGVVEVGGRSCNFAGEGGSRSLAGEGVSRSLGCWGRGRGIVGAAGGRLGLVVGSRRNSRGRTC